MKSLISYTDFQVPYKPNLSTVNEKDSATIYISKEQQKFFIAILGYLEYNKLLLDLNNNDDPQSQHWIDFVDGCTYTDGAGDIIIYGGILEPLKLYCYYMIMQYNTLQNTGAGVGFPQMENAVRALPNYNGIAAYSELIEKIKGEYNSVYNFLTFYADLFPKLNFDKDGIFEVGTANSLSI